jgi:hypothetical protein
VQTCGEVEIELHAFIILAICECELSASCPSRSTSSWISPIMTWRCVAHTQRASLNTLQCVSCHCSCLSASGNTFRGSGTSLSLSLSLSPSSCSLPPHAYFFCYCQSFAHSRHTNARNDYHLTSLAVVTLYAGRVSPEGAGR